MAAPFVLIAAVGLLLFICWKTSAGVSRRRREYDRALLWRAHAAQRYGPEILDVELDTLPTGLLEEMRSDAQEWGCAAAVRLADKELRRRHRARV